MKKVLKWIVRLVLGFVLLAILGFAVLYFMYNEELPQGKTGKEAEQLAEQLTKAINKEAWDSTRYVQWSFRGAHDFWWDKEAGMVEVKWGNKRVLLNHNTLEGKVYVDGNLITENAYPHIEKAYSYFINDAFWLNAPAQMVREGVEKRVVDLEDGTKGLLITYNSGGVTPGDSYLWMFNEDGTPKSWKMWVGIIPIGGLEASWADWKTLSTGAKVATTHKILFFSIPIGNLKAGMTLEDMGVEKSPFE
ncbi:MAG: hypothetical protein GY810_19080 [Aureispira sp.]|nr:hypothetical protein [Aureispira sp.]